MKRVANISLLTLIFLFIFGVTNAQSNIIGNPIRIENIEVAQFEFPNRMNWNDASLACSALGDGWRLPTETELIVLLKNRYKISNFNTQGFHWTSKVDRDSKLAMAGGLLADDEQFNLVEKSDLEIVRAVRIYGYSNSNRQSVTSNSSVSKNVTITLQNTGNSNVKSECMVIENTKKPNLNFTIIDNRELCICCREKYKRFVLSDLEDKKRNQEVQYLNARLEEHLSKSSADENHIESDRAKLKGYIALNYGMIGLTGSVLADVLSPMVAIFGGSNNQTSRDREIDKYRNLSDYCSKKCEILCSR